MVFPSTGFKRFGNIEQEFDCRGSVGNRPGEARQILGMARYLARMARQSGEYGADKLIARIARQRGAVRVCRNAATGGARPAVPPARLELAPGESEGRVPVEQFAAVERADILVGDGFDMGEQPLLSGRPCLPAS